MVELKEVPSRSSKARNGGSLSESEEKQIQDNLGKAQEKVAAQVAVLGGTVENRLQSAYNGLRVTIDSGQLANVEAIDGVKSVQAIPEQERSNTKSVPYIGAPNVWQGAGGTGYTGKGGQDRHHRQRGRLHPRHLRWGRHPGCVRRGHRGGGSDPLLRPPVQGRIRLRGRLLHRAEHSAAGRQPHRLREVRARNPRGSHRRRIRRDR